MTTAPPREELKPARDHQGRSPEKEGMGACLTIVEKPHPAQQTVCVRVCVRACVCVCACACACVCVCVSRPQMLRHLCCRYQWLPPHPRPQGSLSGSHAASPFQAALRSRPGEEKQERSTEQRSQPVQPLLLPKKSPAVPAASSIQQTLLLQTADPDSQLELGCFPGRPGRTGMNLNVS